MSLHFFSIDEKKRTKEKSSQNNDSTHKAITPPLFWLAFTLFHFSEVNYMALEKFR